MNEKQKFAVVGTVGMCITGSFWLLWEVCLQDVENLFSMACE